MVTALVSVDKNYGMSKNGDMLYAMNGDVDRLNKLSEGNTLIMGNNTFKALGGKAFPKRNNYIITRDEKKIEESCIAVLNQLADDTVDEPKYFTCYTNINSVKVAITAMRKGEYKEDFIILGGKQIFNELLEYCDTVLVTMSPKDLKADTFFPDLEKDSNWDLTNTSEYYSDGVLYTRLTFTNKHVAMCEMDNTLPEPKNEVSLDDEHNI